MRLPRLVLPGLLCGLLLSACGGSGDADADAQRAATADAATVPAGAQIRRKAMDPATAARARWSAVGTLPLVPVSMANLPDGKVMLWAAETRFAFNTARGLTYSAIFDPANAGVTERLVTETGHDMFCPGTAYLADGRLLINGGIDAANTSLYDPSSATWTRGATMNIARGYNASTPLADGTALTLGGSWSGGTGNKHAEHWSAVGGWRRLAGVPVTPFLQPTTEWGGDSHMWLIPTGNGRVLHAGPQPTMAWIDTRGDGAVTTIGPRGDDANALTGNTVMYDTGRVLKVGGMTSTNGNRTGSASAHVIEVDAGAVVRGIAPMNYGRVFHNSVVLPNGQVIVIGGQTTGAAFSNDFAVLPAELFDPISERFTVLPAMTRPRNYHSVALLLPDGRVMSAGGGLCGVGCAGNQANYEILSPPYLFNADGSAAVRPAITSAPAIVGHGTRVRVTASPSVAAFAMVRLSSTTHTVNNDQRRLPIAFTRAASGVYDLEIPANPGVALAGHWMLFAMDAQGVPSIAHTWRLSLDALPALDNPGDQVGVVGTGQRIAIRATDPAGRTLTWSARGLPPGVSIDPATGEITGAPSADGRFVATVSASNGLRIVETWFPWVVARAGALRFVRLEALSEVNGNPWTSIAELDLFDADGLQVPRTGWTATADSQQSATNAAGAAIDGNPATLWHTTWSPTATPMPHWIQLDLRMPRRLSAMRIVPRADGTPNGTIARYRVWGSADGTSWGTTPLAEGDLSALGAWNLPKTVSLLDPASINRAPTWSPIAPVVLVRGVAASIQLAASDPDGEPVVYTATGLPAGLAIDVATGRVSGIPQVSGDFAATVIATDARGASARATLSIGIDEPPIVVDPIVAAPTSAGTAATFSARATGTGLAYRWDFGDGSAPTAFTASPTVTHTYASAGRYTVVLTVRDVTGATVTTTFEQRVDARVDAVPPSSTPIAVERRAVGDRLWVVNPDNDSVSVIDPATRQRVAEIAVGAAPRTVAVAPDGRVWVANRDAASLSVIDPMLLRVVATHAMPRASQPYGLAFAPDGRAWVALEASGRLVRVDAAGVVLASIDVGPNPRHLAITADGARVLVSRFVTPPLAGESTAAVNAGSDAAPVGGQLVVVGAASATVERTVVLGTSARADTAIAGRGVPNYLGAAAISPDGRSAWVPSKQDNVQRGLLRDGRELDFQNTVRAVTSRVDLGAMTEIPAARIDHDNSSVTSAAVFHPGGRYLFAALETSRQVAVIDVAAGRELMRIEAGLAPQGVAVSSDGRQLYVHNFMDRSVGLYDLTSLATGGVAQVPLLATVRTVGTERLAATVLRGKQLFYDARDPRLARDAYMSCASCHNDGGHDGRTWDLTGFGEGLRNTISLRGRAGAQGRLHWSANFDEVQDFEGQIRRFAGGTGLMTDAAFAAGTRSQPLGDRKTGASADLDALAAYVASLTAVAPSPQRAANGALTAAAVTGEALFAARGCGDCHGGRDFTASATLGPVSIGTIRQPGSGQRLGAPLAGIDPPTLRDAWATAPYLHDGRAPTIADAIRAHQGLVATDAEVASLARYVAEIGDAPAPPADAQGLLGQYFAGIVPGVGTPLATRNEAVDFDWGAGAPSGVTSDRFSARWTGTVIAPATGSWRFQTVSDDGVRLWVDNRLVIDNWTLHGPTTDTSATVSLEAGRRYAIRLEYYEQTGGATIRLRWQRPGTTAFAAIPATSMRAAPAPATPVSNDGLRGEYFAGMVPGVGTPLLVRNEAVDVDWGTGSPGAGVPTDRFAARWTGTVRAEQTGSFRLRTISDDGVRLWINGRLVIDNWTDHAPTANDSAPIDLVAGQRYDVRLEYFENGGGAVMRLQWLRPGITSWEAIPAYVLAPPASVP